MSKKQLLLGVLGGLAIVAAVLLIQFVLQQAVIGAIGE